MVGPIALGTYLRQRYLVQAILGQGGFGRTYLAIDHERFDECCVLKEFVVPYDDEPLLEKSRILFQREASTLYQIQHPQIPRFWAAFEAEQRLFLVQDFVDGHTYRHLLQEYRKQGQTFSEAEIIDFLTKILPVLGYIHDRGIIHRDISPDNIILKSNGVGRVNPGIGRADPGLPIIIDFGAVKEATTHYPLTSAITRVGKVGYAPPEQLQTGQVFPNSDLYSLAATCLVLLTGKEPRSLIDSRTLEWQWQSHAKISDDFGAILKRMLSVYPGHRYPFAQDVLNDLNLLLQAGKGQIPTKPIHQPESRIQPAALLPTSLKGKAENSPSFPPQLSALPRPPHSARSPQKPMHPKHRKGLRLGMLMAFLMGTVTASLWFWQAQRNSSSPTGDVWVSGAKLPQSEASKIIGSQGSLSDNALTQSPLASVGHSPSQPSAIPQTIQFAPGKISTTIEGTLQETNVQSYRVDAAQGQILTATLNGTGVVMNLLRSNQEGIDAAAYQTRSWTGQLPAADQYLIQVSGSGGYTLDVAITPTPRPMQEQTDRITFARGTNGTTVTGSLTPNQIRRYLLRAKRGQLVLVKVIQGQANLQAIAPNGQPIGSTTAIVKDWKGQLPMDGDYVLEVSANQPGDYALSVEIF
jgi:serine/threonine-protein kinase